MKADKFDYEFLRFDAGRAGRDALEQLKASPDADVAKRAAAAVTLTARTYRSNSSEEPEREAQIVFHPKGARPPEGFLTATTAGPRFGGCLSGGGVCDARLLDITGDGRPEVLMSSGWEIEVIGAGEDGRWRKLGGIQPPCSGFDSRAAIRDGKLNTGMPAIQDLVSPSGRMRFDKEDNEACPPSAKP